MPRFAALLLVIAATACSTAEPPATGRYSMTAATDNNLTLSAGEAAPLDPARPIAERDCSRPIEIGGENLRCR
jgi:hypothetical protein